MVYIGRGGEDMHKAITPLFEVMAKGLSDDPDAFNRIKIYFIGTSYASAGQGVPTIAPLAKKYGIENNIIELTDRISYYHTLTTLQRADALFIPGSDDPAYTASKIYPYLLIKKPLLAIFNSNSPAVNVLKEYGVPNIYCYDDTTDLDLKIYDFLKRIVDNTAIITTYNQDAMNKHSAQNMAKQQCDTFNRVLIG